MDILEFLTSRRSIRKYTDEQVTDEELIKLLTAAMYAPSAKNFQPWHFICIRDRKVLDQIMAVHQYASMLKYASVAILICGDKTLTDNPGYLYLDGANATMNILTCAHGMKLGACWLGIYPNEGRMDGVREIFKLPENIVPISMVSLGHTDQVKDKPERFHPDRIHYDKW